jgi:DNA mismatch repair protein MSH6
MGGKSTLLRMTCLLAILAQVGIFVPCQYYSSHIFDRIFTRLGASDRLLENKSTFFI